jgi:hypothetical protein
MRFQGGKDGKVPKPASEIFGIHSAGQSQAVEYEKAIAGADSHPSG